MDRTNGFRTTGLHRGHSYSRAALDEGLRSFMLSVYNYMSAGLALTGFLAYFVSSSPALMSTLFSGGLQWVVLLAPLGIVFYMSFAANRISAGTAQTLFFAYAALMGVSLATVFMVYTGESIARVFFITAGTFAATSLYGYTTKKDLSQFGSLLFMGLIGILLSSVVNIWLASPALHFATSVIGVLVFTGLTAYDTQMLKETFYGSETLEEGRKKAVFGALRLYLDFINMFMYLLRLLGDRR